MIILFMVVLMNTIQFLEDFLLIFRFWPLFFSGNCAQLEEHDNDTHAPNWLTKTCKRFFARYPTENFLKPLESRIFLLNRHNFCCLKKQSLLRSSKSWVHKKCAMVGQHQIKCGHELGAVFFSIIAIISFESHYWTVNICHYYPQERKDETATIFLSSPIMVAHQ